jgi:hypothetical protein
VATLAVASLGCEGPQVAECGMSGRFARLGADAWCFYPARATTRCPTLLPVSHELPWGERGCAARRNEPLPGDLCVAAGRCADGGAP